MHVAQASCPNHGCDPVAHMGEARAPSARPPTVAPSPTGPAGPGVGGALHVPARPAGDGPTRPSRSPPSLASALSSACGVAAPRRRAAARRPLDPGLWPRCRGPQLGSVASRCRRPQHGRCGTEEVRRDKDKPCRLMQSKRCWGIGLQSNMKLGTQTTGWPHTIEAFTSQALVKAAPV